MWAQDFIKNILGKWWPNKNKGKILIGKKTTEAVSNIEIPLLENFETKQSQEILIENNVSIIDKFLETEDYKNFPLKDIQDLIVEINKLEKYALNKLENLINKWEYWSFKAEKEFMDIINRKKIIKTLIESNFNINKLINDDYIDKIKKHELTIEDDKLVNKTIESEYITKSKELSDNASQYSKTLEWLISNREYKENQKYTTYELNKISNNFIKETKNLDNLKKEINPYIVVSLWYETKNLKELIIELKNYIEWYNQKSLKNPPQLAKPILYQTDTLHNMIDALEKIYKSRIQVNDITKEHYAKEYNEINYKLWVISSFKHSLENNLWWDNRNNIIIKEIYEESS